MASSVRNVCAKNRQNPLIILKVTIDNVGVPFLRHSVDFYCGLNNKNYRKVRNEAHGTSDN